MTSKHFIAGIVLTALAATAGSVWAEDQAGRKGHGMGFEKLDADGNGEVTKEEMQAAAQARFAATDADADGKLSRDELLAQAHKRAERRVDRMLARLDADGDGALSPDERPGMAERMLEKADTDGSGGISREEFQAMRRHGKRGPQKN